jgi:ubiquinone/menaquinone biosynthesis C-methylase UbiE
MAAATRHNRPMADRYVPAAGFDALTRLYDPIVGLTMRESRWRPALRRAVLSDLPPDGVIADVGAGTGTVALDLAETGARVIAIDGDPKALEIAQGKDGAERVEWREGLVTQLPLEDHSVDRVVVSLVLHHLSDADKHTALTEMRRVLRPDGRLHVADWGQPRGLVPKLGWRGLQLLDGVSTTKALSDGRLPELLHTAGFPDVTPQLRLTIAYGTLELYIATP